jgi:hypothetical protein
MGAGSYENIRIKSPYSIKMIQELTIEKEINNHGTATVVVLLENENATEVPETVTENDIIKIVQEDEENPITLFSGIPKEVTVRHVNNQYYMELQLISNTIKLDYEKKSRSFQHKENPYKNIFDLIIKQDNGGDFIDTASKGATQDRTIIQYFESDWKFLVRLSSHMESYLVAETEGEVPKLWIGLPVREVKTIEKVIKYSTYKPIENYQFYVKNGGDNMEFIYLGYKIESYDYFELCDTVIFKEHPFVISKVRSVLKNSLLVHEYTLADKNALKTLTKYNETITGVTITGKVLKVENDKIKVHLSIDKEQKESEANLYQLSTMYTTEGTTGWYCTPEIGANVYLYIPTSDEDKAFIRGISREDGATNPKTSSPVNKYMGNTTGKELKMDDKEVKFTSKEGKIFTSLNVDSGITIQSNHRININSNSNISFYGKKINISAKEKILLEANNSSLIMDNITHLKAHEIIQNGTVKK